MKDAVSEINKFFLEQGFEQSTVNDKIAFQYKDNYYYRLSGGEASYFLEYAETLEEAEKNMYWDMGKYSTDSGIDSLVAAVKADIIKYIVEEYQENREIEKGLAKVLQIISMYKQQESTEEIAEKMKLSKERVEFVLKSVAVI